MNTNNTPTSAPLLPDNVICDLRIKIPTESGNYERSWNVQIMHDTFRVDEEFKLKLQKAWDNFENLLYRDLRVTENRNSICVFAYENGKSINI